MALADAGPGGKVVLMPFAPMRRVDVDALVRAGVHPAAGNATAWEHQRMRAVSIENGQFEITVERRRRYIPPHVLNWIIFPDSGIEIDHIREKAVRAGRFDLDQGEPA